MRIMSGKIGLAKIGDWFDRRLQLAAPIREVAEHPVPRNTASWFYVFGSAALTIFLLQLVTGILLAIIYVPSAAERRSSPSAPYTNATPWGFIPPRPRCASHSLLTVRL